MSLNINFDEMQKLIDCIDERIHITDGEGRTIMRNRMSREAAGLTQEQMIGRSMEEVIQEGLVNVSSSLLAIQKREQVRLFQKTNQGRELIVTSTPLFDGGEIKYIITTERNITRQYEEENEERNSLIKTEEENFVVSKAGEEFYKIVKMAMKIAPTDATVLVLGESGTGKERIANFIHHNSKRKNEPFIRVNCGAIPEELIESELFGYERGAFTGAENKGKQGLFEIANHGTLFLDEVGELPLEMQPKLLRALQEREIRRVGGVRYIPVDIRVIAATNCDLKQRVEEGKFRKDLYYRLNVIPLHVPPLRRRKKEIVSIALFFLDKFNEKYDKSVEINGEIIDLLIENEWPGNVRELENMIERYVILSESSEPDRNEMLKCMAMDTEYMIEKSEREEVTVVPRKGTLKEQVENLEKEVLIEEMKKEKNIQKVAEKLGMDRSTINRKIVKYQLRENAK